jgi:predicted lysophospholipase L1 biosynthesis ABC-type transport system permease subunit
MEDVAAAEMAVALGTAMGAIAESVIVAVLAISVPADAVALLAAGAMPLAASVVVEAAGLELEPPPQAASVRQKSRGDMLVVRIGMMDFRSG